MGHGIMVSGIPHLILISLPVLLRKLFKICGYLNEQSLVYVSLLWCPSVLYGN